MKDIINEINILKESKNAIILAHYYERDEIQDIADFVGDSLALSRKAANLEADVILFCGVYFMAESAKILSPDKTVLLPVLDAGCAMADMVTKEDVLKLKQQHPEAAVVSYVNSSAEVKAVSDVCCTSSNAVKVVKSLPQKEIIFVPDKNLGHYVSLFVPDKKIILHTGYCPAHDNVSLEDVKRIKQEYPDAPILVHPECNPEVVVNADFVGSTAQIIEYAGKSNAKKIIIGTERGVLHKLKQLNPTKQFYLLSEKLTCADMKKCKIEDVLKSLQTMQNDIQLDHETIRNASSSLKKMLEI